MHFAAVIAEYNPFHNGHLYQLQEIRRRTGADGILIMMSGDFVQRGEPACIDKFSRCRMALESGADVVCELPVYGALGSAEIFAHCAVSLLNQLDCIDWLCFGAETDDVDLLSEIARILANEPELYREYLKSALRLGQNFPTARSRALEHYFDKINITETLRQPNNILAIEYMKALFQTRSTIQPVVIRRVDAGYHSHNTDGSFSSAAAIRHQLSNQFNVCGQTHGAEYQDRFPQNIIHNSLNVPECTHRVMTNYFSTRKIMEKNDFSDMMAYRLLDPKLDLLMYVDVTEDIANRIDRYKKEFQSVEQFINILSARNLTATRIARCLFHILLGHEKNILNTWTDSGCKNYLRVLGFNQSARNFWREIPDNVRPWLITGSSDGYRRLNGIGLEIFKADEYASRLYRQILRNHCSSVIPDIASEPIIILNT